MQNGYDLYRSERTPLPHWMQCFHTGGGVLSHHKPISIFYGGDRQIIGYVRITNDGEVLSVWIDKQKQLFLPEVTE